MLTTLLVYFLALALCLWRFPQADRWHVVLCLAAAILWCGIPVFVPETRTIPYAFGVVTFLICGLAQPLQRRRESRFTKRA